MVPKWAEFGQNQKYQKISKTEVGKVTKFQKATPNGLGVIKNNPNQLKLKEVVGKFNVKLGQSMIKMGSSQ